MADGTFDNLKVTGNINIDEKSEIRGKCMSIHYGNRGKIGEATKFNPDNGNNGLWIEGSDQYGAESAGIFLNGNTMCLWSPGDNDILRVYDEDGIGSNQPNFVIAGNGNVGIVTSKPEANLHVNGSAIIGINGYPSYLQIGNSPISSNNVYLEQNVSEVDLAKDPFFRIMSGNIGSETEMLRLSKSGMSVGGGSGSIRAAELTITGYGENSLTFQTVRHHHATSTFEIYNNISDVDDWGMNIDRNNTNLLNIGNPAGGFVLRVNGSALANGIWANSDARFKENVALIDAPLEKLMKVEGVQFNWKTKEHPDRFFPEEKHFGVIAQDIEKVIPEVVITDPGSGEKAVAYSELIPLLIEALKEQKRFTDLQQQRIESLETAIEEFKAKP